MKDGDIYQWAFKEPSDHMPYHCCARIAIFRDSRLTDTYWHSGGNRNWDEEMAAKLLTLTFLANEADLEVGPIDAHEYYAPEDIVDLRHPNSSSRELLKIRKGAQKQPEIMLETIQRIRGRAEYNIARSKELIVELASLESQVRDGILDGIYLPTGYLDR